MSDETTPNAANCLQIVRDEGQLVDVYDMPKAEAEALRVELTKKTGRLHDWHYSGGRVIMLALPEGHPLNPGVDPNADPESSPRPNIYGSNWV